MGRQWRLGRASALLVSRPGRSETTREASNGGLAPRLIDSLHPVLARREPGESVRLFLLVVILAGAAWLRGSAVGLGRPFLSFQPDEDWNVGRGLLIGGGGLNPHVFFYPALWWELLAVVDRVVFAIGHALGLFGTWADLTVSFARQPLLFFAGRLLNVGLGTATVGVLYCLGRRVYSPAHGLLAAALLGAAFLHVRDSALATVDAPMTAFVTLSLLGAVRVLQEGRARDYALAAGAAGLAAATKYNGGVVLVAMGVAHALRLARTGVPFPWLAGARRVLGAGLLAVLVFLGLNPFLVWAWREAWGSPRDWGSLRWEWEYIHTVEYLDLGPAWWYHLTVSLRYGLGLAVLGLALLGILRALWRRDGAELVVLSFTVTFFVALGGLKAVFVRYMTPLIPVLCLFAASALLSLTARLPWPRGRPWVTAALALLAMGEPLAASAAYGRLMRHANTTIEAEEFIQAALLPDTKVATYGPNLTWRSTIPRRYPVMYGNPADGDWAAEMGALTSRDIHYVLTHQSALAVFSPPNSGLDQALQRSATLVCEFAPYRRGAGADPVYDRNDGFYVPIGRFRGIERPGPLIRLYHLNGSESPESEDRMTLALLRRCGARLAS